MKIYRGPRTTDEWQLTDTKKASEWADDWRPGVKVALDGTIEKEGTRHTDLGVEIEADDVVALASALFKYQKLRIEELEPAARALKKINRLVALYRDEAPSDKELLDSIQGISAHFSKPQLLNKPFKLDWIDLDSV